MDEGLEFGIAFGRLERPVAARLQRLLNALLENGSCYSG